VQTTTQVPDWVAATVPSTVSDPALSSTWTTLVMPVRVVTVPTFQVPDWVAATVPETAWVPEGMLRTTRP
jgi:hypothetical protein